MAISNGLYNLIIDSKQCWPNTDSNSIRGGSPIQIFGKSGILTGIRIVFANIRTKNTKQIPNNLPH